MSQVSMKRLLAMAAVLAAAPLLYVGTTAAPAFAACGDSSASGDNYNGSWTKSYDPDCASGIGSGDVTVHWSNGRLANGDRYVRYDFSVTTHTLANDNCVELAIDWGLTNTLGASHSDAQIMRNCFDHSTMDMTAQTIDIDADPAEYHTVPGTPGMPVARIQVSTYNPGGHTYNPACPGDLGFRTDNGDCGTWDPDGVFSSNASKIRRMTNAGTYQQNDPLYPQDYNVDFMFDPNS